MLGEYLMAKRRRKARKQPIYEDDYEEPIEEKRIPRRSRRRYVLLAALLLALTLVFLAPTIVARTSVRDHLIPVVAPEFPGRVNIGAASLGWFSPIALREVSVTDAAGDVLLRTSSITSEKTLFALVTNPSQAGLIRVEQPVLDVELRADGSNLEDALQPLLDQPGGDGGTFGMALQITDGTIHVADAAGQEDWTATDLDLSLTYPANSTESLALELTTAITGAAGDGHLATRLTCNLPSSDRTDDLGQGEVSLETKSFPLATVQPVLRRLVPQAFVAGTLESDLTGHWDSSAGSPQLKLNGTVHIAKLACSLPRLLGEDILRAEETRAEVAIGSQHDRALIDQLSIDSDLGRLRIQGAAKLSDLMSGEPAAWLTILEQEDFQLSGSLDLARLAAALPSTLRLRAGTQVMAGDIRFAASSAQRDNRRRWTGVVETGNVEAVRDGRRLTWKDPIRCDLSASQTPEGIVIDELICQSDFLKLTAQGRLDQGHLNIEGRLQPLAEELNQLVDLGQVKLQGKMLGQLQWASRGR